MGIWERIFPGPPPPGPIEQWVYRNKIIKTDGITCHLFPIGQLRRLYVHIDVDVHIRVIVDNECVHEDFYVADFMSDRHFIKIDLPEDIRNKEFNQAQVDVFGPGVTTYECSVLYRYKKRLWKWSHSRNRWENTP